MPGQEKKIKTINNYPLAFTVFIFTALLTTFINRVFSSNDDRSRDCLEQVQYLRGEVASLRGQIKEQSEREAETQEELKSYVRTLLLKDAQIKELAKRAKELNLDAIHDTVHEMAKDEARHGAAFNGLLNRYFK